MEAFPILIDYLKVEFECPHCHEKVIHEFTTIPSPDWSGDTASDSENVDDEDFQCLSCKTDFCADIFVNIYEGNVEVTDVKSKSVVKDIRLSYDWDDEE